MSKKEIQADVKFCKGVAYELVGDKVIIHGAEGDVTLPLELGKSAYAVVFQHLKSKTGRTRVKGANRVGNFTYKIEGNVMSVLREDQSVVVSREISEQEQKYPRNAAINMLLATLK